MTEGDRERERTGEGEENLTGDRARVRTQPRTGGPGGLKPRD